MNELIAKLDRTTLCLSNRCPNALVHVKCPAHHARIDDVEVLPRRIVYDVIDTLAANDYTDDLAWHVYNEPLIDPRLSEFTRYARKRLPRSAIILWSSGCYLSRDLAKELISDGITLVRLSAYNAAEDQRLSAMGENIGIPWTVFHSYTRAGQPGLDDRLVPGEVVPHAERLSCGAPLGDLTIWPTGEIGLCCYDWERDVTFGSLRTQTLLECLQQRGAEMLAAQATLQDKRPAFDVCRHCNKSR